MTELTRLQHRLLHATARPGRVIHTTTGIDLWLTQRAHSHTNPIRCDRDIATLVDQGLVAHPGRAGPYRLTEAGTRYLQNHRPARPQPHRDPNTPESVSQDPANTHTPNGGQVEPV